MIKTTMYKPAVMHNNETKKRQSGTLNFLFFPALDIQMPFKRMAPDGIPTHRIDCWLAAFKIIATLPATNNVCTLRTRQMIQNMHFQRTL
jgi:hypothetical protein